MFKAIFNNAFGSIVRARQGGLRPRPSRARRARPAPTMTEQLEGRRLLSFTFVGGVVTAIAAGLAWKAYFAAMFHAFD